MEQFAVNGKGVQNCSVHTTNTTECQNNEHFRSPKGDCAVKENHLWLQFLGYKWCFLVYYDKWLLYQTVKNCRSLGVSYRGVLVLVCVCINEGGVLRAGEAYISHITSLAVKIAPIFCTDKDDGSNGVQCSLMREWILKPEYMHFDRIMSSRAWPWVSHRNTRTWPGTTQPQ